MYKVPPKIVYTVIAKNNGNYLFIIMELDLKIVQHSNARLLVI